MSIAKLLKDQRDWLNNATKNIDIKKITEKDLDFSETLKLRRKDDISEKITTLKRQKEEAIKRYDQAITDQGKELVRIEKEINLKDLTKTKIKPNPRVVTQPKKTAPILKKTPSKPTAKKPTPVLKKTPSKPTAKKTTKRASVKKPSTRRRTTKKKK